MDEATAEIIAAQTGEHAIPALPVPKYKIGDTIYYPTAYPDWVEAPCPDCAGTATWHVRTDSGLEFEVPCTRCHRYGGPSYKKKVAVTKVHALTVSRITAECGTPGKYERAHKVTYRDRQGCCIEEHRAYAAEDEAHAVGVEMAGRAQEEYAKTSEHTHAAVLSTMDLQQALTFEANRLRIEAEVKYERAIEKIREMKDEYTGLEIRQYMAPESAQEHLARWLLGELDENAPEEWGEC